MKSARFVVISSLALLCCGGGSKGVSGDKPDPQEERASERPESELSSKGKSWGGWRWKGRRRGCFFVVKNRCLSTLKGACAVAKCKGDKECVHDDSAPAKVTCESDD